MKRKLRWVYANYDGRTVFAETKREAMSLGSGFEWPVGKNRIGGIYEVYSKENGAST